MRNRLWNVGNPYQGDAKRVLCVCSAGLLRSPTAAWVLSNPPYNFNTRAAGVDKDHALIPVDEVLIAWAEEIVCMTRDQLELLDATFPEQMKDVHDVRVLHIPDDFGRMDPELVKLIGERYDAGTKKLAETENV